MSDKEKTKKRLKICVPIAAVVVVILAIVLIKQCCGRDDFELVKETDIVDDLGMSPEMISANNVSFKMLPVKGGTFTMGATPEQPEADNNEKPSHEVTLPNYYISETEVTQELWEAVMGSNPSEFKGSMQLPVENVSWNDCQEFIKKLNQLTGKNFRLPTEAEWEYASRGGSRNKSCKYSGHNDVGKVAWYQKNSGNQTHMAGMYKKPNELEIYDMSGNVWEWCQDIFGNYDSTATTNQKGIEKGNLRVIRGGAWNANANECRTSSRAKCRQSEKHNYIGLRIVM